MYGDQSGEFVCGYWGLSASAGKNNLFLCLCFILPVDHGLNFESLVSLVLGPTETCESLLHFNMYA